MYVRLAFAVSAFLEPEILIVDEVLAVGDAEFQKKCLGRMQDVSVNDGRTVLFVSHNMAAVNQLCNKTLSLAYGSIREIGETSKVVSNYLNSDGVIDAKVDLTIITQNRSGNKKVEFTEVYLTKGKGLEPSRVFSIGETLHIHFSLKINNPNERYIKTAIELKTSEGMKIANMIDVDSGFQVEFQTENLISYEVLLHDLRFYPDTYILSFYAGDMSSSEAYDYIEDCITFEIVDGGILTSRSLPRQTGLLYLTPTWERK
jgi:lipopolysaccharide transport system ATP-binding protein